MVVDIFGNVLLVGDTVAFGMAQTMNLSVGVIVKINPKTVTIEYKSNDFYSGKVETLEARRSFDNVVKR